MEFKEVKIASNDPVTKDTLENFQRSIVDLASRIPDSSSLGIVEVNGGTYTTKQSDRVILVDSSGGKTTIVLQLPKFKQVLTVIKKYNRNSVYVVTVDGKPIGNDGASIVVETSRSFVSDESNWWRYGS